jgi:hypothetical protein
MRASSPEKEVHVSDRLKQSLMSSRAEIEAGLAEAESELARARQRARELEELIALGTATLLAAEMISGGAKATSSASTASSASSASATSPSSPSSPASAGTSPTAAADLAAAHEKSKDELQSRLTKQK